MTTPIGPQAQEAGVSVVEALIAKLYAVAQAHGDRSCDYDVCKEVRDGVSFIQQNAERPVGISIQTAGWIYEDDLPDGYPYDTMFPYSIVDIVRMFPVFVPSATTPARVVSDAISGLLVKWRTPDDSVPVTEANIAAQRAYDACARQLEAALSTLQSGAEGKDSIDPLAVALCRISTLADRWEERALEVDSYADSAEDRMVSVCLNGAAKELRTALQPGQGTKDGR